ncbi:MAG: dTMP kinase [Salaquimonas sp.]|nr:dTMP kinase [Salaquimonas sp.]
MGAQKKTKALRPALFITFEGGEGTGKSTQIKLLEKALKKRRIKALVTREPGGSTGAEAVRHVLLSGAVESLGAEMEAILFSAARSDHVETIIRPTLQAGTTVLCDRFFDSTRVYQGVTGKVPLELLRQLERVACEDCWPDLTIILDLDPKEGMKRAANREAEFGEADRFEKESLKLQKARRQAYLDIAAAEPERCRVVDASGDPQAVHERILELVMERFEQAKDGSKAETPKKLVKAKRGRKKTAEAGA